MKLLFRAAAVAALLVPLVVAHAQAQNYRTAWGLYGGGFGTTALNSGGSPENIFLKPGWIAGTQFEGWLGQGRFGLRLNGAFTDRPFRHADSEAYGNVNTYLVDLNGLIRLARPEPDRVWAPFLNLGVGVVHYNPGGDHTGVQMPQGGAYWLNDPETVVAGVVGLGTDIFPGARVGTPVGLRIEAADHIAFQSPLHEIGTEDRFGAVHNIRVTAGLHFLFGELLPPPVAVVPPPTPPAPPPAPPAPPVEERIMVCVIDPAAPGGIREIDAIHLPETRDTLVVVGDERVPLREVVPMVTVAGDAAWYVEGRPLAFEVAPQRVEYVVFGTARVIEPADLIFLGTVDGLPVYASRVDVDPVLAAEPQADLRARLRDRADVWRAFREVEVLYIPADAVGCVFVPLQQVEVVRKIRG